jgi:hypothetical protein
MVEHSQAIMGVADAARELLGSAGDLVPKPTQDSKMVSAMHGGVKQHPDPCFWHYDGPQMAKMCAEVRLSEPLTGSLSPTRP